MGEPVFNRKRRYVNKRGQKFGKGVWLDDKGTLIKPGQGFLIGDDKVVQYNTDGTKSIFTRSQWQDKKSKEHELKVLQNDRQYGIPYIPSKKMTISIDKNSPTSRNRGATFSENLLDSIAVNAKKAGLPFSTALGIAAQESTFGHNKERTVGETLFPWLHSLYDNNDRYSDYAENISYKNIQSPTLLISNWKMQHENPFDIYQYNSKGGYRLKGQDEAFYNKDFSATLNKSRQYEMEDKSPLYHGFKSYKENPQKYNPGDKSYPSKVEANRQELVNYSPEIKAYMKKHNLRGEGGILNNTWDTLSLADKAEMMRVAIDNGITTLPEIRKVYNEYAAGGYKPSDRLQKDITTWEGAEMQRNRPFSEMTRQFNATVPREIQARLQPNQLDALYSYGYNVGMGRLKERVLPTLTAYTQGRASREDVQRAMWATKDSQLRGLARRRNWERSLFGGSYTAPFEDRKIGVQIDPQSYMLPQSTFDNNNAMINAVDLVQYPDSMNVDPEMLYKAPVIEEMLPENTEPEEEVWNERQERLDRLERINNVMRLLGM